ncbi:MAG: glycosyltransferase [Tepidisphaera sp.]|nr:glycosyltransferase [Tepidisphaera sp.]
MMIHRGPLSSAAEMQILHVIHTLDPKAGGPPAVATRLAAAQASLGHQVSIVHYASPDASQRIAASLAPIPGMPAVTIHTLAHEPGKVGRIRANTAAAWLARHVANFDFLHIHGVWEGLLVRAAGAARRRGIPYCLVPHGMLDPWSIGGQGFVNTYKKKLALALVYRATLDHAAFLHVLNPDEATGLAPLRLKARVEIIPNGIFEPEVSPLPAPGNFRAAHPELGDDPYVLFLSRVHFKKGLDFLIAAFKEIALKHPRLRLVIAGPDDGYAATVQSMVAQSGLADRTHLVGPQYAQSKLAAFVDAAAFCLPSRQEGFSVAIIEAMACGIPVVISDQCHFPQVQESGAGIVTPLGAAPTAAALDAVLSMPPDRRHAMGRIGREMVLSRFTWPNIAATTIDAYARSAAPGPSASAASSRPARS